MSSADTQTMPAAPEAERAVLGVIMRDGSIPSGARILNPDDFYLPAHRAIFAAMLRLDEKGVSITADGVYFELKRTGEQVLLTRGSGRVQ